MDDKLTARDARALRYTQAKRAAARWEAAKAAHTRTGSRVRAAEAAFDAILDAAESPVERVLLASVFHSACLLHSKLRVGSGR